jgi:GNAT superfamily N-acetyltransferase
VSLSIRPASRTDCAQIVDFLHGLAAAQGFPERVVATPAQIETLLFASHAALHGEIVEVDGTPAGLIIWHPFASTMRGKLGLYIEDLYVDPAFRGRGLGRAMMVHLARTCQANGFFAMEWSVHAGNAAADRFYAGLGAEPETEWVSRRLSGPALNQLATVTP